MTNQEIFIQLASTAVGTLGFCFFSHVRMRNVVAASVGGVLEWGLYLYILYLTHNVFVASLLASVAVSIWSEIAARILKAPVNIFLIPGILALLPGSHLYYTMLGLISGDAALLSDHGETTLLGVVGIVVGIVAASIFFVYLTGLVGSHRMRKNQNRHHS